MSLGENIYKLRTGNHLSQEDFAAAMEVSRQSVSKWENDMAVPELEKLIKMAKLFNINLDELVSEDAVPTPSQTNTPQSVPARHNLTPQQILGIVLLAFGGISLIVFTVVGIFTYEFYLGPVIALPLLLTGLICLLCKKNIGLKCAWTVYLCIWIVLTVFTGRWL